MSLHHGIQVVSPGEISLNKPIPSPTLRDTYIIVKTEATTLNPADLLHIGIPPLVTPSSPLGLDYTGIIEEVGSDVKKHLKKGDRLAGFVHGGMPY